MTTNDYEDFMFMLYRLKLIGFGDMWDAIEAVYVRSIDED